MQVHKSNIDKIPNALPGRESVEVEIYGVDGIPAADVKAREEQKREEERQGIVTKTLTKADVDAEDGPDDDDDQSAGKTAKNSSGSSSGAHARIMPVQMPPMGGMMMPPHMQYGVYGPMIYPPNPGMPPPWAAMHRGQTAMPPGMGMPHMMMPSRMMMHTPSGPYPPTTMQPPFMGQNSGNSASTTSVIGAPQLFASLLPPSGPPPLGFPPLPGIVFFYFL